jgi:hypothetical protein
MAAKSIRSCCNDFDFKSLKVSRGFSYSRQEITLKTFLRRRRWTVIDTFNVFVVDVFFFFTLTKKTQSLNAKVRNTEEKCQRHKNETGKKIFFSNSKFVSFSYAERPSQAWFCCNNGVQNIKSNILSECINLMCSV